MTYDNKYLFLKIVIYREVQYTFYIGRKPAGAGVFLVFLTRFF